MTACYFRYWGKASPDPHTEGPAFHLLPYHSLDVAAVGWRMLDPLQPRCRQLATGLQVEPAWLQRWFSFCLALHDLGKFASAFQGLATGLSDRLIVADGRYPYDQRHDSLGFLLWREQLSQRLWQGAWQPYNYWKKPAHANRELVSWLGIVTGHHGEPPREDLRGLERWFSDEDRQAAEAFVTALTELYQPDFRPLTNAKLYQRLKPVSWQLAGLAVLADWTGSDRSLFGYHAEPQPLTQYWDTVALPKAQQALQKIQPNQVSSRQISKVKELFPFIDQPTPLQQKAESVELPEGPQLWILEDVTGAGKTEAALTLAGRLMAAGRAEGVYIGLPTMATANGIYHRMRSSYRALFTEQSRPSLILAHGARELSQEFVESVRLSEQLADRSYRQDEPSATAYCNSWLADNRKKALFADVGVGTLDQALLTVLPARHQSLRLLGLQNKILLVDEIHAYSPYMQALLASLLRMHAAQGGSAVLLSATLPQQMRAAFSTAFRNGLQQPPAELVSRDYPLVTCCASGAAEYPVASRRSVCRTLAVRQLTSLDQVSEQIRAALDAGQSVCWIRNTVADARAAWQLACEQNWTAPQQIGLFHSRFAMCDRQAMESDVLARFGKASKAEQRRGQLLIATQVVEQSLDLDFDLMVSDLAPIDLLIQRAGRLHRHCRDADGNPLAHAAGAAGTDQRPAPLFCIYAPPATGEADEDWLKPHWQGSQWVYRHVGQLWLTLTVLAERDWRLRMPEDARELIEGVYGEPAQERIPEALQGLSWDAEGESLGQKQQGRLNSLKFEQGYCRKSADGDRWDSDIRVPTRLSNDSVTVALARLVGAELQPWADGERHRWPLSQISLPEQEWRRAQAMIPPELHELIEQTRQQTAALRWCELLPLTDELADCYSASGGWNLSKEER
ncbi:CRISPR-associated helicase Cas3' [Marinobacterium arenosum]|uniref:CRISPR-associated helicase Cas3' n=1 Tax=Marinobacterium arenosum TaxID=2862496 RepID=UPI001C96EB50|nr:CRISPR-associated helicase Cas3' [Marinobacterium arenosum]MBY4678209.1 CRISPR-associated helicase Cas3' [Marinobacterium arenosum]